MRRAVIIFFLAAIVALPFALRPRQRAPARADDTVVVVTPNNEEIRHEFELGFQSWYRARTGRTVAVDWRVLGGTSEIVRFIQGQYVGAFQNYWTGPLGRAWSEEVQSAFQDSRLPGTAAPAARAARAAFLASEVGCGVDVFFGGDTANFAKQAAVGTLVDSGLTRLHPDWFADGALPATFDGETYRDPGNRWFGSVTSSYGIIYNVDAVRRLGFAQPPTQWSDLADPRFRGEIALCDPTKSSSMATAFENVIQQEMHRHVDAHEPAPEALNSGWDDGLKLIQRIGANARYFTDSSQKPPIDVANGDCAAGMCIDFYGRQQEEALRRRGAAGRMGFVAPLGGTAYSVDPIGLLRGAPHGAAGRAFLEYVLSLDGQKLWNFRPGTPGGPRDFALRRLPVRRDFYAQEAWQPLRSDPTADPYAGTAQLVYEPAWTAPRFDELAFIVRVMCADTHEELASAWRAIASAPEPARARALAILQDMSAVSYEQAGGTILRALTSRDPVDEVRLARELDDGFRRQYVRAEAVATGAGR
jgi:iron(III) transport system substrate-binding protein